MASSTACGWHAAAVEPAGSVAANIFVYDASSGQQKFELQGHQAAVQGLWPSPDGCWLVSTSSSLDMPLALWDTLAGELVAVGQAGPTPAAVIRAVAWVPNAPQPTFYSVSATGGLSHWVLGQTALSTEQLALPEAIQGAQLQAVVCCGDQRSDGSCSLILGDSSGRAWALEVSTRSACIRNTL
jgi:WD40 repeat protein